MGWQKLVDAAPPTGRPLMTRSETAGEPIVAFLSTDGFWYAGGALVQSATTLLGTAPLEWCEPSGENSL